MGLEVDVYPLCISIHLFVYVEGCVVRDLSTVLVTELGVDANILNQNCR